MASPKREMDRNFALYHAVDMQKWLKKKGIFSEICGSIRRKVTKVNDIDMVVSSTPDEVLDAIREMTPDVKVVTNGSRKADVVVNDVPFNFYWATLHEWGAMVLFLTGSPEFNIKCRVKAKDRNLKLNQYGLWRADGTLVTAQENTILRHLGLFEFSNPKTRR